MFQESSNKSAEEIQAFWEKVGLISANDDNASVSLVVTTGLGNASSDSPDPAEYLCNFSTFSAKSI